MSNLLAIVLTSVQRVCQRVSTGRGKLEVSCMIYILWRKRKRRWSNRPMFKDWSSIQSKEQYIWLEALNLKLKETIQAMNRLELRGELKCDDIVYVNDSNIVREINIIARKNIVHNNVCNIIQRLILLWEHNIIARRNIVHNNVCNIIQRWGRKYMTLFSTRIVRKLHIEEICQNLDIYTY